MDERRKYKRYKRKFDVKYTCAKGPLIIEGNAKTRNISEGGVRLLLEDSIDVSDVLVLEILFPWQRNPVAATGRVVWAHPRPFNGAVTAQRDCGVKFTWFQTPGIEKVIKQL